MPDGTLIWVTGASRGIGKALIQAVPWQGARVIGVSRSPGPAPVHLAADLAGPAGWDMAEASFHRELAGFSGSRVVFIHAAGAIGPIGFAGETDPREYRASVLLNAAAPLILGDAFLPRRLRDRRTRPPRLRLRNATRSPRVGRGSIHRGHRRGGRGLVHGSCLHPPRHAPRPDLRTLRPRRAAPDGTPVHQRYAPPISQVRRLRDDELPAHPVHTLRMSWALLVATHTPRTFRCCMRQTAPPSGSRRCMTSSRPSPWS
jgi:NAD(P)-dependent dehydrogenase (short-subunit alcohol dehydrogenase family)